MAWMFTSCIPVGNTWSDSTKKWAPKPVECKFPKSLLLEIKVCWDEGFSVFLNCAFIIQASFFVWAPGTQIVLCEGRQWRLARAAVHVVSSFMIYAM